MITVDFSARSAPSRLERSRLSAALLIALASFRQIGGGTTRCARARRRRQRRHRRDGRSESHPAERAERVVVRFQQAAARDAALGVVRQRGDDRAVRPLGGRGSRARRAGRVHDDALRHSRRHRRAQRRRRHVLSRHEAAEPARATAAACSPRWTRSRSSRARRRRSTAWARSAATRTWCRSPGARPKAAISTEPQGFAQRHQRLVRPRGVVVRRRRSAALRGASKAATTSTAARGLRARYVEQVPSTSGSCRPRSASTTCSATFRLETGVELSELARPRAR